MAVLCEWIVEFFIGGQENAVPEGGDRWEPLAEGAYKACQGDFVGVTTNLGVFRFGVGALPGRTTKKPMEPRPLESCIKRVHVMMQKNAYGTPVRIRNINTNEVILGDILI